MQIRHSKEMIKGVSFGVSIIIKLVLCCPLVTFCMSRILYVGTTQVVVLIYKQKKRNEGFRNLHFVCNIEIQL